MLFSHTIVSHLAAIGAISKAVLASPVEPLLGIQELGETSLASQTGPSQDDGCDTAHRLNLFVAANCYYFWVNTNGNNYLEYHVTIEPTGQNPEGWCHNIFHSVKRICPTLS